MSGQGVLFILALSAGLGLSLCQIITPKPYNQSESDSSCEHGLISDIDTVVFTYEVDLTDDPIASDVYFQTKKKDDTKYNFLCHVNITSQCNHENEEDICLCRTLKKYVMEIKVSIKVHISCNGASIRGTIVKPKTSLQIRSEESFFPPIYESNNTQGLLTINTKEIKPEEMCSENVKGSYLMISYTCISQAIPCVIEIYTDKLTHSVKGNGTVTYYGSFNKSQDVTATIKRAACKMIGRISIITCFINIDTNINFEEDKSLPGKDLNQLILYITIISMVSSILAIIGIVVVFLLIKNRSPHKNFRKIFSPAGRRKEKVDYDEEEELIQKEEDLKDVQIDIFTSIDEDYKHCQKKHKDFMSKKELTLSDLPEHMQNEDVFDLIKTTADLTVMVTFSDDSDTLKKMGTGWIGHILQYTKKDKMKCTCKKCRKSPNYDWGKITVYTSTDVVPNNSNGKQVVCSIFIDDDEDNVLHLQGCEVEAKFHKCRIKFKTCNAELLKKLNKLRQKVTELTYKINTKYKDLNDGSLISDDDERLVIIISYIHGMNRRVSLGSWSHRSAKIDKKNNIEITKYIYTAPTCLGSTGAYVYILGRAHCGWLYQHYHVGVNALNQGFCGYGIDA